MKQMDINDIPCNSSIHCSSKREVFIRYFVNHSRTILDLDSYLSNVYMLPREQAEVGQRAEREFLSVFCSCSQWGGDRDIDEETTRIGAGC